MVTARNLYHRYGDRVALDNVSIEVVGGEIVGLLGANGAGKSTLLRVLAGLQEPEAGLVIVDGHDLAREPVAAKARMGYAPDDPSFYEELSAAEYLSFLASLRGVEGELRGRIVELIDRFGLRSRDQHPVRELSHGMRKKLSFIAAIFHRPSLLLLDEALEGFDTISSIAAREEIQTLARSGSAIIISSHNIAPLEHLCHRALVLDAGRVRSSMNRAQWDTGSESLSPLERLFLSVIR